MNNADFPAMPVSIIDQDGQVRAGDGNFVDGYEAIGLTKREHAAIEMAKIIDPPEFCVGSATTEYNLSLWADKAFRMADALLAKPGEKK